MTASSAVPEGWHRYVDKDGKRANGIERDDGQWFINWQYVKDDWGQTVATFEVFRKGAIGWCFRKAKLRSMADAVQYTEGQAVEYA